MNNFHPSQTNNTSDPNLRSTYPPPDEYEPQGEDPTRRQRPDIFSKADSTEDVWAQLDDLHRMAQEHKKIEEVATKKLSMPITRSEPSLRSRQRLDSDRQDQSSSSTENGFAQHDEKHHEQSGGVDPDFFEKSGKLNRKEISVSEINNPLPDRISEPGPRVNGEWTILHLLAERDLNRIPELIASGASLDAVTQDGLTLLHKAVFRRDANAVRQLLAAGANPLTCNEKQPSPLAYALVCRQEFAMAFAEALPVNSKANIVEDGETEVHMAVALPEVLYVMLSKGMKDSVAENGMTALMSAAEAGNLQSVKYLLGQRPQNEKESDYLGYVNSTDKVYGITALGHACFENHLEIVELLLKHGANVYHPHNQKSLLKVAADNENTSLLKLLLENGAAEYEDDLTYRLFKFVVRGQSEAVQALAPHVRLDQQQQYELLSYWIQNPQAEILAAISPLIAATVPSVSSIMGRENFLTIPLTEGSPQLLVSMLEFFDRRDSFDYVLTSYISIFIEGQADETNTAMGKILLDFALPRLPRLKDDREAVMRLLQLSERLQDYRLATLIRDGYESTSIFKISSIPFNQKWISDPVMKDFLSDVPNSSLASKGRWLSKKLVSSVLPARHDIKIDGAGLSNDLIFALKEKSIGTALDTVFKDHKLSGLVSQTLKYVLEGLVTKLYPDPATRSSAACRMIIGYCFSTLSDHPRFTEHTATRLMQSDDHWKSVKRTVDGEIDEIEQVGLALVNSFAKSLSGETMLPLVTQLVIDNVNNANAESELSAHFQSTLGLLETPARRLALACVGAIQRWQATLPSSARSSRDSLNLSDAGAYFKQSIGQALRVLKQQPKLPDQLAVGLSKVELDLVPAFQQMVWFQLDLIEQAFDMFQPLSGDTIANFVDQLGQTSSSEETSEGETSEQEISHDETSGSEGSAYLESEDSYNAT